MTLKEMIDDLAIRGKIELHELMAMQLKLASEKGDIKGLLDKLSDDERYDIISNYCKYCGTTNNGCQCWNDE